MRDSVADLRVELPRNRMTASVTIPDQAFGPQAHAAVALLRNVLGPPIAPEAWIEGTDDFDPASEGWRRFLLALWHPLKELLNEHDLADRLAVGVRDSQSMTMQVHGDDRGNYAIVFSDSLVVGLGGIVRCAAAYRQPDQVLSVNGASPASSRDAQIGAMRFAWQYAHTGRTLPPAVILSEQAEASAVAEHALGLTFLLCHEVAHVIRGDVDASGLGPTAGPSCLDREAAIEREHAADLVGAAALLRALSQKPLSELAPSDPFGPITAVFEFLDLLDVGTMEERTHPFAMRRLLRLAEAYDSAEAKRLIARLQAGAHGFWYIPD